jgi:hypothetical protein
MANGKPQTANVKPFEFRHLPFALCHLKSLFALSTLDS